MIHCDRRDLLSIARAAASISVRENNLRAQVGCQRVVTSHGWNLPSVERRVPVPPPLTLEICPGCGWRRLQLIRESIGGSKNGTRISQIRPFWLCLRCWWERAADAGATVPVV